MTLEFSDWFKVFDFAWTAVLAGGVFVWRRLAGRHDEIDQRIEAVEKDAKKAVDTVRAEIEDKNSQRARSIGEIRDRLAEVEIQLKHLPDKESVHQISLAVAGLTGDVRSLAGSFEAVSAIVHRLDQYMLETGR